MLKYANHHPSFKQVVVVTQRSQIIITNINKQFEIIVIITKIWHRDTKWANAVGKMMPKDLLDTELHKPSVSENEVSAKCNKTKYACMNTHIASFIIALKCKQLKYSSMNDE